MIRLHCATATGWAVLGEQQFLGIRPLLPDPVVDFNN
jgi:hypothetical protein